MSRKRIPQLAPTIFITALAAACATPKRVDEAPITIMRNGDHAPSTTQATDAATSQALESSIAGHERRDSLAAVAFASCAPDVCAALGRGEVTLGMNEAQVYVATKTTDIAWTSRRSGAATVLTPRTGAETRDAVGSVALVQLSGATVASITYREPQGLRTVSNASDASDAGRARAASLVRDGDALAAAGDFTAALDRYDRASIIERENPELQYRMATTLDKLLRPREAELRYKLFLQQLELQRIDAVGNANARMAAAIAQARERVVVLEKTSH